MKIAYWAHLNFAEGSGVNKKIISQIEYWRKEGHLVRVFALTNRPGISELEGEGEVSVYDRAKWTKRLRSMRALEQKIEAFRPDLVYVRQEHYYPTFSRMSRLCPVVWEINGDMAVEASRYSKIVSSYYVMTRMLRANLSSGAVYVTYELRDREKSLYGRKPTLVLANGINLRDYNILAIPPRSNPPSLAFMGQPALPWHGVDKVIKLASLWPDARFHIIGPSIREIGSAPPNVKIYGFLARKEYEEILSNCHVAISTLAFHRNGLNEACPLKSREFLALGLPLILAYKDTDFVGEREFLLHLENNDHDISADMPSIKKFVSDWTLRRVNKSEVSVLDNAFKEKGRLAFFENIAAKRL
jgi:hypothetical protein